MSTALHLYVIYAHIICWIAFLPIVLADFWLRHFLPYVNRMRRGKYTRWLIRTFGMTGDNLFRLGWLFCIAMPIMFVAPEPFVTLGLVVYWTYMAVTLAVDWITGSDDPPYRKWLAAAKKKLTISAPPKPVIDLT